MKKFRVFDVNTHKNVQYGSQNNLNNRSQPRAQCLGSMFSHSTCAIVSWNFYCTKTHFNVGLGRDNWYALNWVDQRDLSNMVKGPTFLSLTTDLWTVVQTAITWPNSRRTSSFRNANSFVEMGFRLLLLLQYGAMGFQQFSYTNWALKKVRECLLVDFYVWFLVNQSPGKTNQKTPVSVSTRFEKVRFR